MAPSLPLVPSLDLPVVLLSHRGPVSFGRDPVSGERTASRGAGGLVTALSGLAGHLERAVWVCVAAGQADGEVSAEAGDAPLRLALDGDPRILGEGDVADREVAVRLVDVPAEVHEPFYGVIANPLLWFVQHRLHDLKTSPSIGREERAAFEDGYVVANTLAADAVVAQVERAGGKAIVLLHDYHFYLVGRLVRERCPDAVINHFVHIPWPGPEAWQVLPPDMRERLLLGLLGCDVVAFHTRADARAFVLCAQELLDLPVDLSAMTVTTGGRTVHVRAYPISIDVAALEQQASTDASDEHLADLDERLAGGQLVLRVDRTDPSKNIVRGFTAYDLLLTEHPELHGRVLFLALLQPSRQDVPEYAQYLADIGAAAASVNARHGTGDWQPVDLRLASDMDLATAAYRRCDVLVVNAVADGMNLVAKEAVIVNERDMVLALSEATGAHDELGSFAVTLHPFDVAQQADALHAALTMSPVLRRDRREHAAQVVHRNDVRRWLTVQLNDLADLRHG
ncbi:MAG: Alpha,alpha-trehalose-phosphate synthase [UDP-forming] [uncultured Frankineae bacterium]|uniref:Alpha,alpha-trehalose-phosphate synthase [UDP-forming] n=1 Tax=uncultured Frankineae bacterium TaxID=437475 RepID=A0A6J4M0B9_9ACTN|nr:MAG: Alpha,alpha-trehalose-phosphate synthase [UDP-forming] [uncultured Frankineae bacterium]